MPASLPFDALRDRLASASEICLLAGAGISVPLVPAGPQLPLDFGASHEALLQEHELAAAYATARAAAPEDNDPAWAFAEQLVAKAGGDRDLLNAWAAWLETVPALSGIDAAGQLSPVHQVFALAWLSGRVRHLVTTNWDFLLEQPVAELYDQHYEQGDPMAAVEMTVWGRSFSVDAEDLFYPEPLDGDKLTEGGEAAWNPRWDIIANDHDLARLRPGDPDVETRPVWKIHGSPFFLTCPRCMTEGGGVTRWQRPSAAAHGTACPTHPDEVLRPEMVLWHDRMDVAWPHVWERLVETLTGCDLVVACGFSGSDEYIRKVLEEADNTWVVSPSLGRWVPDRVCWTDANAESLARLLADR